MTGAEDASHSRKTVRVVIEGRVQGVWFRGWTVQEASARRLDGWVRNCSDGTVEAVFSGTGAKVDEMAALCWKGPPSARVTDVKIVAAPVPDGLGFKQMPTI